MYVLRVCENHGYDVEDLHVLFNLLIMSLFRYRLIVWGVAGNNQYLQTRAMKLEYAKYVVPTLDLLEQSDRKL